MLLFWVLGGTLYCLGVFFALLRLILRFSLFGCCFLLLSASTRGGMIGNILNFSPRHWFSKNRQTERKGCERFKTIGGYKKNTSPSLLLRLPPARCCSLSACSLPPWSSAPAPPPPCCLLGFFLDGWGLNTRAVLPWLSHWETFGRAAPPAVVLSVLLSTTTSKAFILGEKLSHSEREKHGSGLLPLITWCVRARGKTRFFAVS